jgi:hypothetical protein
VSATGRLSFRQVTLGTGTELVSVKHVEITDLGQGEIENACEDTCQLVCSCFENTPWYLIVKQPTDSECEAVVPAQLIYLRCILLYFVKNVICPLK